MIGNEENEKETKWGNAGINKGKRGVYRVLRRECTCSDRGGTGPVRCKQL